MKPKVKAFRQLNEVLTDPEMLGLLKKIGKDTKSGISTSDYTVWEAYLLMLYIAARFNTISVITGFDYKAVKFEDIFKATTDRSSLLICGVDLSSDKFMDNGPTLVTMHCNGQHSDEVEFRLLQYGGTPGWVTENVEAMNKRLREEGLPISSPTFKFSGEQ